MLRAMFNAYDDFLGLLNDSDKREKLENIDPEAAASSAVFNERAVR